MHKWLVAPEIFLEGTGLHFVLVDDEGWAGIVLTSMSLATEQSEVRSQLEKLKAKLEELGSYLWRR